MGIGASAGGVEAITGLFKYIPADAGMAFIYVQHLAPNQPSMLAEIISRFTALPVHLAEDGTKVESNKVYICPPGKIVTVENGRLKVETKQEIYHYPIDSLFSSLAQDYKANAIGVVLSGTGTDGTVGLKAIYAEGGLTIVQRAESAKYPGMPTSAITEGVVHFALSLEEISKKLMSIKTQPFLNRNLASLEPEEEKVYANILTLLKLKFGVDFGKYKESTVNRRITRRMLMRKVIKLGDYLALLNNDSREVQALYNDMLIGVTQFFREPDTFARLSDKVLPQIIKDKKGDETIRVWVPGCATGEEAYSVAICVREALEKESKALPIQVFGTDLNENYITKAREGVYLENIALYVSESRLNRFFHKINGEYQVNKLIRDLCVFSKHDLINDPPFSNMDLIICRNVLIYVKSEMQERILRLFHYGLKPTGFLILGRSESVGKTENLFLRFEDSIFKKREAAARIPIGFEPYTPLNRPETVEKKSIQPYNVLQKSMNDILLTRYGLASALVNESGDVLVFQNDLSPYMQTTSGEANLNLLNILRDELRVPVQTAIIRSKKEKRTVKQQDISVSNGMEKRFVDIEVTPLKTSDHETLYMVMFENSEMQRRRQVEPLKETRAVKKIESNHFNDETIIALQKELQSTQETLRSIIEDYEATNEELRAALEEVQSGNEELQSTNEELETAKEELQSVNEELNTVNRELVDRNETLNRLNDDLNNIFNNINVAVIVLDVDLRIRLYTPIAGELFNFLPTDVGRPITDIRLRISVPDIEKLARDIIKNLYTKDIVVKDETGHTYLMRIRPYITADKKINGAVVSLVDIDTAERKKEADKESKTSTKS